MGIDGNITNFKVAKSSYRNRLFDGKEETYTGFLKDLDSGYE
jgi:hypothetical protein